MKIFICLSFVLASLFCTSVASAQKYKTAADTIKLNKEYLEVSSDIASLTARLNEAQNDLPGIRDKAGDAGARAQNAADNSSNRADKVSEGDVKDAKRAKRSAKTAYKKAKSSQSADANVKSHEKKIGKLSDDLAKKQKRLQQLTDMRTAIYSSLPAQTK